MLYGRYTISNGNAKLIAIGTQEALSTDLKSKKHPDQKIWTTKITNPLIGTLILNQEYPLQEFLRLTQSPRHKLHEDEQEQYTDQIIDHVLKLNKNHGQKAALNFLKRIITNFACDHNKPHNQGTEPDTNLLHLISEFILK